MGPVGRQWLAASGGVLINGLILAALVLVEEPPLVVEDPPVIALELERAERQRPQRSRPSAARSASSSVQARTSASSVAASSAEEPSSEPPAAAPPAIEPAWRIDPKAVERWRLTEGDPAHGWGRYARACRGLSNEHMTPEEKELCYGGWNDRKDRRPSPAFVGPIDETKWEAHEFGMRKPPTADDDKRRRRDLCRTYGRLRKANPAMAPVLRQGACP